MRLRRRCGRRYKKMMTNMGLAGCSLPRSLFRPQREGGRDERGREGRGREGGTEGANGLSEKQTTTPPPPPNGPQNEASDGMEHVDDRARIPARAVTAIPRHPISPSPSIPCKPFKSRRRRSAVPLSLLRLAEGRGMQKFARGAFQAISHTHRPPGGGGPPSLPRSSGSGLPRQSGTDVGCTPAAAAAGRLGCFGCCQQVPSCQHTDRPKHAES